MFKINVFTRNYGVYYNVYKNAAITANSEKCAEIGRQMIEEGGSVVDAAIATLICGGCRNPERMGLGGGFVLTMYHKKSGTVEVLIARERAPILATRNMFQDKGEKRSSLFGGLASAIPGSLMGYWELHKRYGRLSWSRLFQPSIALCRSGIEVEPFTKIGLNIVRENLKNSASLTQILVDSTSGKLRTEKIYRHKLAKTLEFIAEFGADVFYKGYLTEGFVQDVKNEGGIITRQDMENYRVKWVEPVFLNLPGDIRVYAPPPPASGPVLLFILNTLVNNLQKSENDIVHWQKIIEIWKWAYGYRSKLGDTDFASDVNKTVNEMLSERDHLITVDSTVNDPRYYGGKFHFSSDRGTAHFNIIHPSGDAIAITESINNLFGAMYRSISTGIILNNTMDDFSLPNTINAFALPPSICNEIQPGKMPQSSMTPAIVIDKNGDARMCIGGAGGTRIITSVSLVIFKHLYQGMHIAQAIDADRLHHQLMPMELRYEPDFPEEILFELQKLGHTLNVMSKISCVSAITRVNDELHAKGDWRRHCATAGF